MWPLRLLAAILWLARLLLAQSGSGLSFPSYSPSSIVNLASQLPGPLAPNTIASISGTGLAYGTRWLTPEDVRDGVVPTILLGTGVRVLVARILASIFFVSPGLVNFLVPAGLEEGPAELQLVLDGRAGPAVTIQIGKASPALLAYPDGTVMATRPDGSLVTRRTPAPAGEVVTLYATGLGETAPPVRTGEIVRTPAWLAGLSQFQLILDRSPVAETYYVGLAPGFAGLYQINFRIPRSITGNPEVVVWADGVASPGGFTLPVDPN